MHFRGSQRLEDSTGLSQEASVYHKRRGSKYPIVEVSGSKPGGSNSDLAAGTSNVEGPSGTWAKQVRLQTSQRSQL